MRVRLVASASRCGYEPRAQDRERAAAGVRPRPTAPKPSASLVEAQKIVAFRHGPTCTQGYLEIRMNNLHIAGSLAAVAGLTLALRRLFILVREVQRSRWIWSCKLWLRNVPAVLATLAGRGRTCCIKSSLSACPPPTTYSPHIRSGIDQRREGRSRIFCVEAFPVRRTSRPLTSSRPPSRRPKAPRPRRG